MLIELDFSLLRVTASLIGQKSTDWGSWPEQRIIVKELLCMPLIGFTLPMRRRSHSIGGVKLSGEGNALLPQVCRFQTPFVSQPLNSQINVPKYPH